MPVKYAAGNDGALLVGWFAGPVSAQEIVDACAASAKLLGPEPFCSLLIFDHSADLSELDMHALDAIRTQRRAQLQDLGLRRRAGAAAVDGSLDAKLIMPLWNALSDAHPESELPFEIFVSVEHALAWLGVSPEIARPAIDRCKI